MTQTLTTTEELKHLASSDNTNELTRRLARECLANREAQPVEWGAPKTVGQMIGQLKTLDPAMETTALQRMPADFRDGNAIRQVPISISFERLDGMWLAPYKGEGRKVLAFWAKVDHREETERGDLFTAPPAPAVHNVGDWRIDMSTGVPILMYKDCSVIESEQAEYVLSLIQPASVALVGRDA